MPASATWRRRARSTRYLLEAARRRAHRAGRAAHRIRYLPLAGAALGAILVWLGPGPHLINGDRLTDDSMSPTIAPGALVVIDRRAFAHRSPQIGQIVSFHPPVALRCARPAPPRSSCDVRGRAPAVGEGIKRIVAGPGDSVALRSGHLVMNGREVSEPYDRTPCRASTICELPRAVTLARGTWWLLADNRNASNDSRRYGPIPTAWITGLVAQPGSASATAQDRHESPP